MARVPSASKPERRGEALREHDREAQREKSASSIVSVSVSAKMRFSAARENEISW